MRKSTFLVVFAVAIGLLVILFAVLSKNDFGVLRNDGDNSANTKKIESKSTVEERSNADLILEQERNAIARATSIGENGELQGLEFARNIDWESFDESWEVLCDQDVNYSVKIASLKVALRKLLLDEGVEIFPQLFGKICETLGSGYVRESVLEYLFSKAEGKVALLKLADQYEFSHKESHAVYGGFFDSYFNDYALGSAGLPSSSELSQLQLGEHAKEEVAQMLAKNIGESARWDSEASTLVAEAVDWLDTLGGDTVKDFLATLSSWSSELAFEYLMNSNNGANLQDQKSLNIASNLIKSNVKNIDKFLELGDGANGPLLGQAMATLAFLDLEASDAWLKKNSEQLSTEQLSHASRAVGLAKLAKGDLSGAKEIIEKIEDSEVRRQAGGALWNAENKLVIKAASENPQETVIEMANGSSDFEPLYLPTALNAWMKEDGEAAAQWVENEGVNLTPETRQYVAMAYAREAAKQGKFELADQWAALIVDEERKARVIKEIDGKR